MLYLFIDDLGNYKHYSLDKSNPESVLLLDTPRRFYKSRDHSWGTII